MMKILILVLSLLLSGGVFCQAKEITESDVTEAVGLYEKGSYNEAMDAFVDVLNYGNSKQQKLANDYINEINFKVNELDSSKVNLPDVSLDVASEDNATEKKVDIISEIEANVGDEVNVSDEDIADKEFKDLVKENVPSNESPEVVTPFEDSSPIEQPSAFDTRETETVEPIEKIEPENLQADNILFTKPKKIYLVPVKPAAQKPEFVPAPIKAPEAAAIREFDESFDVVEPMQRESASDIISASVSARRDGIIKALKNYPAINVVMSAGMPEMIVMDTKSIFSDTINFKPGVRNTLSYVSGLLYTLRDASFTIFPEGISNGSSTLLDMRRAMAINTVMLNEGISKARLKVQLASDEQSLDYLNGADGIVVSVAYNKTYSVKKLISVAAEEKPELTLGVYPEAIAPAKGSGVIIEFAVIETAAQIEEWKLEVRYAEKRPSVVVMKAEGTAAGFHQAYWNGRKNLTGAIYPGGKYICVLTARDAMGRQYKISRVFEVVSSKNRPLPDDIKTPSSDRRTLQSYRDGQISGTQYEISFKRESVEIDERQFVNIRDIARQVKSGKGKSVDMTSYGYSDEPEYETYALRRANLVKEILVNEYGLSSSIIRISVGLSENKPYISAMVR